MENNLYARMYVQVLQNNFDFLIQNHDQCMIAEKIYTNL